MILTKQEETGQLLEVEGGMEGMELLTVDAADASSNALIQVYLSLNVSRARERVLYLRLPASPPPRLPASPPPRLLASPPPRLPAPHSARRGRPPLGVPSCFSLSRAPSLLSRAGLLTALALCLCLSCLSRPRPSLQSMELDLEESYAEVMGEHFIEVQSPLGGELLPTLTSRNAE